MATHPILTRNTRPPVNQRNKQPKGIARWPHVLQYLVAGAKLGPATKYDDLSSSSRLALAALGSVAWQLRRSLIDVDLLSMQVRCCCAV